MPPNALAIEPKTPPKVVPRSLKTTNKTVAMNNWTGLKREAQLGYFRNSSTSQAYFSASARAASPELDSAYTRKLG